MKRVQTGDLSLQLLQDNVAQAIQAASPMAGGVIVAGVKLSVGANVVGHGLGHPPRYWTLLDNQAQATVSRTAWDSKTITLQASAATTVILWVA